MEAIELMRKVDEFIDSKLKLQIARCKNKEIVIDFLDVLKYSMDLAESILDDFNNTLTSFENILSDSIINVEIRFKNLPEERRIPLWKIRNKHLNNIIQIEGFIRKVGGVNHIVEWKQFECSGCGNKVIIKQTPKPKKPGRCSLCGSKVFIVASQKVYDFQKVILEEDPVDLSFEQKPERKMVVLTKGLTIPSMTKRIQPSIKVRITGVVSEELKTKDGLEYRTFVTANNIEFIDDDKVKLTYQDIQKIKEISKTENLLIDMARSISPKTHGLEDVRKAMFLQLIGADHAYDKNVLIERGTINMLFLSNPGTGKTQLLKRAVLFLDRARYVGSSTASGVGLVGTIKRDEELGDWGLEPGAIPLANKSQVMIDEIDKIKKEDIGYMNIAIDKLEVPFDKANVHTLLKTETAILAAANPKHRVFDDREKPLTQIDLPKDFLDRFDLIFRLPSIKSETDQRLIADMIFSKYGSYGTQSELLKVYDVDFVKKYIFYAKQIKPVLGVEARNLLKDEFIKLIKPGSEEEGAYFSSRMLMNLIRLSVASAKARLSENVEPSDAMVSINLMKSALTSLDLIRDNILNVVGYEEVTPKNTRDKYYLIKKLVKELDKGKGAEFVDILERAQTELNMEEMEIDGIISKLAQDGEIYEKSRGKYKLL